MERRSFPVQKKPVGDFLRSGKLRETDEELIQKIIRTDGREGYGVLLERYSDVLKRIFDHKIFYHVTDSRTLVSEHGKSTKGYSSLPLIPTYSGALYDHLREYQKGEFWHRLKMYHTTEGEFSHWFTAVLLNFASSINEATKSELDRHLQVEDPNKNSSGTSEEVIAISRSTKNRNLETRDEASEDRLSVAVHFHRAFFSRNAKKREQLYLCHSLRVKQRSISKKVQLSAGRLSNSLASSERIIYRKVRAVVPNMPAQTEPKKVRKLVRALFENWEIYVHAPFSSSVLACTAEEQACIQLSYVVSLSDLEIARVLGLSEKDVKNRLDSGRRTIAGSFKNLPLDTGDSILRQILERDCIEYRYGLMPRMTAQELEALWQGIELAKQRVFQNDFDLLDKAQSEIWILGINALGILHRRREALLAQLLEGVKFHILLLDPQCMAFLKREVHEEDPRGTGEIAGRLRAEYAAAAGICRDIFKFSSFSPKIELRVHSEEPTKAMVVIDPGSPNGSLNVNSYPSHGRGVTGAHYALSALAPGFELLKKEFVKMWEKAHPVNLGVGMITVGDG